MPLGTAGGFHSIRIDRSLAASTVILLGGSSGAAWDVLWI